MRSRTKISVYFQKVKIADCLFEINALMITFQNFNLKDDSTVNLMYKEFKRLKFDPKMWRISEANKKFE